MSYTKEFVDQLNNYIYTFHGRLRTLKLQISFNL